MSAPALSIRQPWAWAICNAGKTIENRAWRSCKYRGPVWIHASLWGGASLDRISVAAQDEAYSMLAMAKSAKSPRMKGGPITLRDLYEHRGGIVGRARIVGEVKQTRAGGPWMKMGEPGIYTSLTDAERAWWIGGFGLVLADVEPVPFVECAGKLGLFKLDDSTRSALARVGGGA